MPAITIWLTEEDLKIIERLKEKFIEHRTSTVIRKALILADRMLNGDQKT